jgi:TonB family protein
MPAILAATYWDSLIMIRRLRVVLCLLAFLPCAYAAGKDRTTELDFVSSAWVDVDAKGHGRVEQVDSVTKLDKVPALAPAVAHIKEVLKERIESWEFIPATRDGVAVSSRTYLYVEMEGMDDGKGGLGIRILSAHGGPQGQLTPPTYPPTAYRNGIQGGVLIDVGFDDQGVVTSVEPVKSTDPIIRRKFSNSKFFVEAAIAAARAWTFKAEQVGGFPVPGRVRVPVSFCLAMPGSSCGSSERAAKKADVPRDGEFLALDPAVKLRSAVAGTAL